MQMSQKACLAAKEKTALKSDKGISMLDTPQRVDSNTEIKNLTPKQRHLNAYIKSHLDTENKSQHLQNESAPFLGGDARNGIPLTKCLFLWAV